MYNKGPWCSVLNGKCRGDTVPAFHYKRREEKLKQYFSCKYLLSPSHVPGTEVGAWGLSVNKTEPCFCGMHILSCCRLIKMNVYHLLTFPL